MPRPAPVLGRLLRAPVVLYELGAAPLLGHRFLLLVHRGTLPLVAFRESMRG